MASASNKTETETVTVDIAPAMDPIDTITEESVVSSSLNEEEASSDDNEDSVVSDEREEEEDSESNGEAQDYDVSDGEDEEDSQSDGDSIVDDGDSTDDKPEWGVDSYDESEYCSPDEDSWSDEEDERKARLYGRNLYFSHGFLVEKGIRPRQQWTGSVHLQSLDSERSPVPGRTQLEYTQDMAKLCLRRYNALNETDVKMDHVVRVTESFSGSWVSYITFMARESEEEEATLVEYQAKAVKNLGRKSYPIFCRPSPKQDQDM